MDYRAAERWDARKTSANTADLRGKIVRITPARRHRGGRRRRASGTTYAVPAGNMFAPGTAKTRPEIYAMGFRQPFTLHTDPANPGTVGVGEYCHDTSANQRRPRAGRHLRVEPASTSPASTAGRSASATTRRRTRRTRWNYAAERHDRPAVRLLAREHPVRHRLRARRARRRPEPTFDGPGQHPRPGRAGDDLEEVPRRRRQPSRLTSATSRRAACSRSPARSTATTRTRPRRARSRAYYDGSWLINNRGADNGFWKEVRLRKDNNQMLRVHDWLPYNAAGSTNAELQQPRDRHAVRPRRRALHGAASRSAAAATSINAGQQTQIVKIEFNVQDECLADTQAPNVSHELDGHRHTRTARTPTSTARR